MKRPAGTEPVSPDRTVTVLLVRTHSPGNLGSAARAVTNFGARLSLVDPRVVLDHPDVAAHASGADATLAAANRFACLAEAASHHDVLVALTSSRGRVGRALPPAISVSGIRRAVADGRSVGLVFGPERSGLLTSEILECDKRWILPTEPSFPTLNLSHAVAVSLALLRGGRVSGGTKEPVGERAGRETWRRLLSDVRRALAEEFPLERKRPDVVDELVAALRRARPTRRESELLLAALTKNRRMRG